MNACHKLKGKRRHHFNYQRWICKLWTLTRSSIAIEKNHFYIFLLFILIHIKSPKTMHGHGSQAGCRGRWVIALSRFNFRSFELVTMETCYVLKQLNILVNGGLHFLQFSCTSNCFGVQKSRMNKFSKNSLAKWFWPNDHDNEPEATGLKFHFFTPA